MEVTDILNFDSFLMILFSPMNAGGWTGFFSSLALIPALLVGLNFSDKIKNANKELIDANPTSISNPIIFKIFGLLFFITVAINFFTSASGIAGNVDDFETFIIFVKDLLIEIFWAIVGFAVANLYFQPERVNISVDKSSTVAEDLIALLSFGLKVPLVLSKMLSQTIILYGVYLLFFALVIYYSEGMYIPILEAISTLIIGAFAPFLFYLLFLFLFPIFNFYLAILHIPKIGKDK